jgi:hypothetical protein
MRSAKAACERPVLRRIALRQRRMAGGARNSGALRMGENLARAGTEPAAKLSQCRMIIILRYSIEAIANHLSLTLRRNPSERRAFSEKIW